MAASSIPEYRGEFTFGARFDTAGPAALFKGQLTSNSRLVVIEIIAPPFDPGLDARLLAEASLKHENIWAVLALFRGDDQVFLVRERLENALPLPEFLRREPTTLAERVRIMIQVAKALEFAHANGVIHRDLVPARIFVLPGASVRVSSFSMERAGPAGPADALGNILDFGMMLREAAGQAPDCPPALLELADRASNPDPQARCQSFGEIVQQAEAGLKQLEEFTALVERGQALLDARRYAEAIPVLQSAAKLGPLDSALLDQALGGLRGEPVKPAQRWDENVQFTVYRPRVVRPGEWKTLLAFAHLSERPPDDPEDSPDPLQEVRRRAGQMLGGEVDQYQDLHEDASAPIPAEGELTFVPEMNGIEFNPPRLSFLWNESVHQAAFRLRALPAVDGSMARGQMCVYLGSIVVAQIPLRIEVNAARPAAAQDASFVPASAARYRKIFASYSHRDAPVVQEFERYGRAMGDEYLRDVIQLRSGEVWNDRLFQMIDQADVFQLFWSSAAMRSEYVRREYQYALSLNRECFVRPVYWEEPLPESAGLPPENLRALHFHRVFPGVSRSPAASGVHEVPPTGAYSPPPVHAAPPAPAPAPLPIPSVPPRAPYSAPPPAPYAAPPAAGKPKTALYTWAAAAVILFAVAGVGMLTLRSREPITTAENQPAPITSPAPVATPQPEPEPAPPPAVGATPPRAVGATPPRPRPAPAPTASPEQPQAAPPDPRPTAGRYRLMVWSRGSAVREGQIIAGSDPQLQCFVIGAADSRAAIQVRWFVNGRLTGTMNFQGAEVAKAYRGLPSPGQYRAVLVVDGEELSSVNFSIQAQASPLN